MKIRGKRVWIVALDLLIGATFCIIVYISIMGGIDFLLGGRFPMFSITGLSCNDILRPFVILVILFLLRVTVFRLTPVIAWLKTHRHTIMRAGVIACVAAFPRFWNLSGHGMNPDALLWMDRGQKLIKHLRAHQFKEATARLGHPGIVPAALIGISLQRLSNRTLPFSDRRIGPLLAGRLPIAVIGTLTCIILYMLGRLIFGDAIAFWAAVFLSLFPYHIHLSRVAHIDSTLTLFFMLSCLCFIIAEERGRLTWKIISGVCLGLALLTKSPAYLLPVILFLWKAVSCALERDGKTRSPAAGDLLWLGIGLAIYFTSFTKLWYETSALNWAHCYRFLPQVRIFILIIGGIASCPWLQITAGLFLTFFLFYKARTKNLPVEAGRQQIIRPPLKWFAVLLLVLSFIQVFHRPLINELVHASSIFHIGELGHLKYWMGQKVSAPSHWFYLFMMIITTPPLLLIMLVCGLVSSCVVLLRRERGASVFLLPLLVPFVVIGVMSVGRKMAIRYIDPATPFLCILEGVGLLAVCRLFGLHGRRLRQGAALAGSAVVVALLVPLIRIEPNYDIYCNFILGGPRGASRLISFGTEVGMGEAVDYLKEHARDGDAVYALGIAGEFRYCWLEGEPMTERRVLVNRTPPRYADWLVIPAAHRAKMLHDNISDVVESLRPVFSVQKCGVDFLDIYRQENPPVQGVMVYEGSELKTSFDNVVDDPRACRGRAVHGKDVGVRGRISGGPYVHYTSGCWRAVFRLRVDDLQGNASVARLFITGIHPNEVIASREIKGNEFRGGCTYAEFTLPFCISDVTRLQFCVETSGAADLYLDNIAVYPRHHRR